LTKVACADVRKKPMIRLPAGVKEEEKKEEEAPSRPLGVNKALEKKKYK